VKRAGKCLRPVIWRSTVNDELLVTGLIGRRSAVELLQLRLVLMSGGVPGPRGIMAGQSGVDHTVLMLQSFLNDSCS